jgi:hypothetical protein
MLACRIGEAHRYSEYFVGWVERSLVHETHHVLPREVMGFADAQPILRLIPAPYPR